MKSNYEAPKISALGEFGTLTQLSFEGGSGDSIFKSQCPLGGCEDERAS
jgi:hypothetical protein